MGPRNVLSIIIRRPSSVTASPDARRKASEQEKRLLDLEKRMKRLGIVVRSQGRKP